MKKQNNHGWQTVLLASIVVMILLGASVSTFAQTGAGKPYGARDPRTCTDTKAPTRGAMTAELATKYVICSEEHVEGGSLYLAEDLTVQVGGAVPYNPNRFPFASDIDTKAPVYPIRAGASLKEYQCSVVSDIRQNKGYNCTIYPRPNATGVCVKTTFGDWRCSLTSADLDVLKGISNMPPPGGAKAATPDKGKLTPAGKNDKQTADKPEGANENKDENGLPKPDFSEMEKYFEISKVEYSTADKKLYFIGKMTKKVNGHEFLINFYDEDGVRVIPESSVLWRGSIFDELGVPAKFYAYLPDESKWKFVKKVVITRHIY